MDFKGVGNGRKNIKLDQALFIDIGPLNRDPGPSRLTEDVRVL